MNSLFNLSSAQLSCVNVEQSIEIFRDLLWCHARKYGVSITKIHISSRVTVSDGGVDAKIDDDVKDVPTELLVSSGTSYQLKTGTAFKPWQASQLRKELFGSTTAEICIDNLAEEVRRCIKHGNRYVMVCFGTDPTATQINNAREQLKTYFEQCGLEDPQVEVWGQTHLVGLISEFPSIVLKISGKSEYQFQTLSSWASNDDMTPSLELGKAQEVWINEIRDALRTTDDHLRIIGEPGIGKSRLILEALSEDDLAPGVIYISHAGDFQKSQLFNELIREDSEYRITLVVDECQEKERASIWNVLKSRRSKCQLISIDHGPEKSSDDAMRVLHCPLLDEEHIAAIINSYIGVKYEAERWAAWCSGSPRVAHAVGQNLKNNPDDIFKEPATVPIWERFIAGYDDSNSEVNRRRLIVLRHIALFQRFGFESPVSDEAKFISNYVKLVDPGITWGEFQSIIEQLRERRILQGRATLFLVPKALHTYLWLDYWTHYGRGFDFKAFIANLPKGLVGWFMRMFIYAHANPLAEKVVKNILAPGGSYDDENFSISEHGTNFLCVLAEAAPKETLQCIERTYGAWSKERLSTWESNRQRIVWALEKIAVWSDTFKGAARILLKMGSMETSNYINNSSGTFCGLFSMACGPVAPVEASPPQRLPVLEEALRSTDTDERELGLKACKAALSTSPGFRVVGSEYQGLRPVAKLWMPKTYGEVFDGYRAVWNLLLDVSRGWSDEERKSANNILINAAGGLLHIGPLGSEILTTIEGLLDDSVTELREMIEFIVDTRRFRSSSLPEDILERINLLDAKIAGSSLKSQINRYVLHSTWMEERDEDVSEENSIEKRVTDLAERAIDNPDQIRPLIAELVRAEGRKLYHFALEIGKRDKDQDLLPDILDAQRAAAIDGTTQFIGGYLRAIREISESDWEKLIIELMFDNKFAAVAGQLVWRTGINNNVLKHMLRAYTAGILNARDFYSLSSRQETEQIEQPLVEESILVLLNSGDGESLFVACDIAESFYCDKKVARQMPKNLIFELLTRPEFFTDRLETMQGYYWSILAKKYLDSYPESDLELFNIIITYLENEHFITLKSNNVFHSIAERVAKEKPLEAWAIIKNKLTDLQTRTAQNLLHWLGEDLNFGDKPTILPLTYFPTGEVLAWIAEDPDNRAPAIARATPKTLDKTGDSSITRELLHRYSHLDRVRSALFSSFSTGGWSGSESAYLRKKRDRARYWLKDELSQPVIEWITEYIDELTSRIERAEISEEREF